jgi:hypothetical protein
MLKADGLLGTTIKQKQAKALVTKLLQASQIVVDLERLHRFTIKALAA